MAREIYSRTHGDKVYLYISFDNRDEISLILTEKEASDLATQLGFACQDIEVVRRERKLPKDAMGVILEPIKGIVDSFKKVGLA